MQIALVTLFPEMFAALTEYGITGRAVKQGLLDLSFFNPRDYTSDRHRTVDDRPYGGGPGMLMLYQPLKDAITEARSRMLTDMVVNSALPATGADAKGEDHSSNNGADRVKTLYLSPQGKKLDQAAVERLSQERQLIMVAGRYEGIDERLINSEIDEEWSVGDYVVSGGELPAMLMIDAMVRLLPGALGHQLSAQEDSFADGLLDCPHYTRPECIGGMSVPKALLSGNHEQIRQWRLKEALARTRIRRPDLLVHKTLDAEQSAVLEEIEKADKGLKKTVSLKDSVSKNLKRKLTD